MRIVKIFVIFILAGCGACHRSFSQERTYESISRSIDAEVSRLMDKGDIPGMSLVIINGDQKVFRNYGYSDLERKMPVSSHTLFELGSCSKAFTALAIVNLERQDRLRLDDDVSLYIPWFRVKYKNKEVKITIRQLLHHTSGIPWNTISKIPQNSSADALEQTVRQLTDQELNNLPGSKFEYATIGYDVLALVIQYITKQPFERYVREDILDKLQLGNTTIGYPIDSALKSTGYKIGFFRPRKYRAPVFRGNNAAGYVISDAEDIANWLRFQMGLVHSELYDLADSTHQRDETVPLHDMSSYAMGWQVSLNGSGEIYHDGFNPNYTSYIVFRQKTKIGVAVLANSNSAFTPVIGDRVMKLLAGEKLPKEFDPGDGTDKVFSVVSIILGGYVLVTMAFLTMIMAGIIKKRRKYKGFSAGTLARLMGVLVVITPFLFGLYILAKAISGFTWESIIVWSSVSLPIAMVLFLAAIGISYLAYAMSLCFPEENKFKRIAPRLLLLSTLAGLANMGLIVLITSSLDSKVELKYLLFYYALTVSVNLLGKNYVQTNLIRFSRELTYELRIKLIDKIFSTSYQKFEVIDRGRIYTALNDDLSSIGNSTNTFITLVTSSITAAGAFLFLATIAFWSTALTLLLLGIILVLYYSVSKSSRIYFEEARNTQNVFMRLTNGMIDGFKEISLRRNKKLEYKADIADCAGEYKEKISVAAIRLVNVNLVGELVLVVTLGLVAFAFPKLFPEIPSYTIMSFIIILLYLIGPINGILNSVPAIMQLKIAWNRIQQFLKDIPANIDLETIPGPIETNIMSIGAKGVTFQYKNDQDAFTVGPIDLEVMSGEILFIIGGNGSGKSTLAKLLAGLYEPDKGELMINNKAVKSSQLSEYFSTVFSPIYLFGKLYDIDLKDKSGEIEKYLELLDLDEKVKIVGNKYSTINLSGGQRKRLALLQCYLEDSPIYLFDEWAADQDPDYRRFFYRTLLPEMREKGKIIIAITHDDHYFDVADKILKMNQGKLEVYYGSYLAPIDSVNG